MTGKKGIVEISIDYSLNSVVDFGKNVSELFDFGSLKACYISEQNSDNDLVLLPHSGAIAIAVEKGTIRDLLIDLVLE